MERKRVIVEVLWCPVGKSQVNLHPKAQHRKNDTSFWVGNFKMTLRRQKLLKLWECMPVKKGNCSGYPSTLANMLLIPSLLKRQLNFCVYHLAQRGNKRKGREDNTSDFTCRWTGDSFTKYDWASAASGRGAETATRNLTESPTTLQETTWRKQKDEGKWKEKQISLLKVWWRQERK